MPRVIERIRRDHEKILGLMDQVEVLADDAGPEALKELMERLVEMREALRAHEMFEEEYLSTVPFSRQLEREVGRIRRENGEITERVEAFGAWLDGARDAWEGAPPASALAEGLQEKIKEVVRLIRDHIHRENVGLFFLAGEALQERAP